MKTFRSLQHSWSQPRRMLWLAAAGAACLSGALPLSGASFKYSAPANRLYVYGGGSATLSDLKTALPGAPLTVVDSTNAIWLLSANLVVQDGCSLILHGLATGGDVNELRLLSLNTGATNSVVSLVADYGTLDVNGAKITSWDTNFGAPQSNYLAYGRAYVSALSSLSTNGVTPQNSAIYLTNSEVCFLGDPNSNEEGLLWKVNGVDPNPANNPSGVRVFGNVVNSKLHDNYIGAYTFGATNMVWLNNQFYGNTLYGLELQSYSEGFWVQGNSFTNNGGGPLQVVGSDNNIFATNSFTDASGKLRFQSSLSNWLDGNSVSAGMAVHTEGDTNAFASTYVRNESSLNVELGTNGTTYFEDAQGRIYQPNEGAILTAISSGGSLLTLDQAGIGTSTTVLARNLFATAAPGTAGLNQLVWNPPALVQWSLTAGSVGQTLNFTVGDLTARTNYLVLRNNTAIATLTSDASGRVQFSDTAATTGPVTYVVKDLNTNLASIKYSATLNKIYVYGGGSATLSDITNAVPTAPLALVDPVNKIWLLSANLVVQDGSKLVLHGNGAGGDVNELRLLSLNSGAVNGVVNLTADFGTLDLNGVKVTSWDTGASGPDTDYLTFGRAYVAAFSSLSTNGVTAWNSRMDISNSEICFLGDTNSNEQGLLWKVSGVDPNPANNPSGVRVFGNVVNSRLHDNYIGAYTFGATNMVWLGNQVYSNAQYGLDLQNYSENSLIQGNTFSNNAGGPLVVSESGNNLFATNSFADLGGKLRFESSLSNWLDGNSIAANLAVRTEGAATANASTYIRNASSLNVELGTNGATIFEDAQGRIYQPDETAILTAVSASGSALTLDQAGIGTSTTVVAQNLFASATPGTAYLSQLVWNPPALVQWAEAGAAGQTLRFTVGNLSAHTNYVILRDNVAFTNVTADATGQLKFSDVAANANTVTYAVESLNTNSAGIKYSAALNNLYVYGGGSATLSDITNAAPNAPLTLVDPVNKIWLLSANLVVQDGSKLVLHGDSAGGDVNQLRLLSLNTGATNSIVSVTADWGRLDLNGVKVTSWDTVANGPQLNYLAYGRASFLVRSSLSTNGATAWNSRMDITNSEICFLGDTNSNEQGLVWRVSGVDPNPTNNPHGVRVFGNVVNSRLHNNYIGAYVFGATNMVWLNNEIYSNAQYGLDLQDHADGCLIQANNLHDNANHGLLASVGSGNLVVTGNTVGTNGASGIMLNQDADGSLLEYNFCLNNVVSGISLDGCAGNTVLNNLLSGNQQAGLRLTLGSSDNVIENNESAFNSLYGIYCFPGNGTPDPGSDDHPKRNLFVGNLVHDNGSSPVLFSDSDDNTLATNTFTDASGKLRFVDCATNWLDGNSLTAGISVRTESDTNIVSSTFVRNEPSLNVELGTNAATFVVDAKGRIYQPSETLVPTSISASGSVLALTPAGIGSSTTVIARDFFGGAAPGAALVDRLVWTNATSKKWEAAGSPGQTLSFTLDGFDAGALCQISRGGAPLAYLRASPAGQVQFTDTVADTNAVTYAVTEETGLQLFTQKVASGTNGFNVWWTAGTLQHATNMAQGNWQTVPTTNGQYMIFISPNRPADFFRITN